MPVPHLMPIGPTAVARLGERVPATSMRREPPGASERVIRVNTRTGRLPARDELSKRLREIVTQAQTPDTISGWKAMADGLLTSRCCAFHRNMEISSRYAWMNEVLPDCFKWAAMAAIASYHARLALYPLRLDTDRAGLADIRQGMACLRMLLIQDVNTIRSTNNAIFEDIFWAHLAYAAAGDDGIERLRALLRADDHYSAVLAAFESIDRGRRVLETEAASAGERRIA